MPPKPNTLIAVVGPTASGKTALAIALAKELGGEIVSADSMQIYRGMDIATAKPTPEEMAEVPHHLIGFWPPEKPFSVAQYAVLAREKIDDILRRGRVPVLCGGTGLYIKAIVDHIQYEEETGGDAVLRERLRRQAQDEGNLAVWRQLQAMDPQTAERIHPNNLGRVIRAIEVMQVSGRSIREQEERSRQAPCPYHVLQIGLRYRNRENLYERIGRRVDAMAEAGLLEEARAVRQQGLTATAAQAIGYKELYDWMDGTLPLEEALDMVPALLPDKTAAREMEKIRKQMSEGTMDVRLTPQGTLAEKIRAGGFGLGGVLTPTGIGTDIAEGKQVINVDGKDYLLETALKGDVCLIKGSIVDKLGNVYYKGTTKNFCPLMAAACKTVIVEAEKLVEPGEIAPEDVMTPFVLVDYIVVGGNN